MGTVWDKYRKAHSKRLELSDLEGYWVDVVPTSMLTPAEQMELSKMIEKSNDELTPLKLSFKKWIVDWNFEDESGNKLPLPSESDEWLSMIPFSIILAIAKSVSKLDEELIPKAKETGS